MRPSLVLLASLATSTLAYPTDITLERRTFGLLKGILGDVSVDVTGILDAILGHGHGHASVDVLVGLDAQGAAALEGGALGCKAGVINAEAKVSLQGWLPHAKLDASLKTPLLSWCSGGADLTLSADVLAGLSAYIPGCAEIAAKGQLYVTVDGIFPASNLESSLVLNLSGQASLSAWIGGKAGLDVDVKAGLGVCAAGGVVGSLTPDVKANLLGWVNGPDCDLTPELKASVLPWCNGQPGGELVELGTVGHVGAGALSTVSVGASVGVHVETGGHLSVGGKAALAAFLDADVGANIGADVQLCLKGAVGGKFAADLDIGARTKLGIWLASPDCGLGVELKAATLLWLSFPVEADASVSLGLTSGHLGNIAGLLTPDFLGGLSVDLRGALSVCAAGGSIADLSFNARAELAAFLGGCSDTDLEAGIQIVFLQWFTGCEIPGAPAPSSPAPSLPSGTGASASVPTGPAPTGPAGSASTLPGGSVATLPGGPAPSVSTAHGGSTPSGPAPSGPAGSIVTLPGGASSDTETSEGAGSTIISGVPVPTSNAAAVTTDCDTEASEIAVSTVIPNVPAASGSIVASSAAWSSAVYTSAAPTGPAPTGDVSSDSDDTTDCDTEASEIAVSTVIPNVPAASGSIVASSAAWSSAVYTSAAPTGPAPTGDVSSDSDDTTDCDTETSEIAASTAIPYVPAASGSIVASSAAWSSAVYTSAAPTGPAPTGDVSSDSDDTTDCDTETSEIAASTVIPDVPAGTAPAQTPTDLIPPAGTPTDLLPASTPAPGNLAATTPCETETAATVGSSVIPGISAPTGSHQLHSHSGVPTPSGPAPTSPPALSGADTCPEPVTVTVTATPSACACE